MAADFDAWARTLRPTGLRTVRYPLVCGPAVVEGLGPVLTVIEGGAGRVAAGRADEWHADSANASVGIRTGRTPLALTCVDLKAAPRHPITKLDVTSWGAGKSVWTLTRDLVAVGPGLWVQFKGLPPTGRLRRPEAAGGTATRASARIALVTTMAQARALRRPPQATRSRPAAASASRR